jgi:hypothetical protein
VERLWEHIEHLAPGLVLAILGFFGLSATITRAFPSSSKIPPDAVLVGGAFVVFGYLLGVINSSLTRFVFLEMFPVLDWLRWRHLERAAANSQPLSGAIADARWRNDFDAVKQHVNEGSRLPWHRDSGARRKRAVFHSLSGRAQKLGGALGAELAQRRREARLMRSAVFPAAAAGAYLGAKALGAGLAVASITALGTLLAYYYREVSVIETFEVHAEALYEKKFKPLGA